MVTVSGTVFFLNPLGTNSKAILVNQFKKPVSMQRAPLTISSHKDGKPFH